MSRRVAAGLPSRMAHNRSSLLVAVAAALVAAALPGCGSDGTSDQPAEQEETTTAPAPSTSESPGSSPPAAPAASGSRCTADMLRAVSAGGQGAAGTQFAQLRFELRGPGQCTLRGYPGVTLLNGGRRFDVDVGRSAIGGQPRTVRVAARNPAYFDVSYRNDIAQRPCDSRVTVLGIIPPDERQTLGVRLPEPLRLCLDSVRVGVVRATSALNPDSALAFPGEGAAAATRSCSPVLGEGTTPKRIRATNESCREAKKVAGAVGTVTADPFNGCVGGSSRIQLVSPCVRRGYRCRTISRIGFRDGGIRVSCRRGTRSVKIDLR